MLGNISSFFIGYLFLINIIGLITMFVDKKFAQKNHYRISERFLFTLSIIGGTIGVYLGMIWFRHKTKKSKFVIGLPIILFIQMMFLFYF